MSDCAVVDVCSTEESIKGMMVNVLRFPLLVGVRVPGIRLDMRFTDSFGSSNSFLSCHTNQNFRVHDLCYVRCVRQRG